MAIVLGSGLGDFADHVADAVVLSLRDIPGWPASAVVGHAGKLVVGHGARPARGRAGGPRALLRGPPDGDRRLRDARAGDARREDAAPDQRRRRHQHVVRARAR